MSVVETLYGKFEEIYGSARSDWECDQALDRQPQMAKHDFYWQRWNQVCAQSRNAYLTSGTLFFVGSLVLTPSVLIRIPRVNAFMTTLAMDMINSRFSCRIPYPTGYKAPVAGIGALVGCALFKWHGDERAQAAEEYCRNFRSWRQL